MAINSVWLLPALALALVIIFPVFATNRTHLITRWKSSKRRRLLFVRITIVTLLLATVVTLVWPVGGTTGLVQGAGKRVLVCWSQITNNWDVASLPDHLFICKTFHSLSEWVSARFVQLQTIETLCILLT